MLALQSRRGKANPHGARCTKDLMSIASAAFGMKPLSIMIMRFAWQERSWTSLQARVIAAYAKARVDVRQLLDGRWRAYLEDQPPVGRPRRPSSKVRCGPRGEDAAKRKLAKLRKLQKP
jgi:hypothetical protein